MKKVPFTRVAGVQPLIALLEDLGAPVARLAERAGLPVAALGMPDHPVSMLSACAFYELAARSEGIEDIGSLAGKRWNPLDLGTYGQVLRSTQTLRQLLELSVEILPQFTSGYRSWLLETNDDLWYCMRVVDGVEVGRRQATDVALMLTMKDLRLACGPEWTPTKVLLPAWRRLDAPGLEPLSDANLRRDGDFMGIAIPKQLLARSVGVPVQGSHKGVRRLLEASAPPDELLASLRHLVISLLPDGYPRLERTAEVLGLSARTLQRRLRELGLTYTRLVEQARLELGRSWLESTERPVTEIALDLGYQEPSNFSRAFRRWAGVAPSAWRRA